MSQHQERSLVESPGWMVLCMIWFGWSAASTASAPWVRLGCLVFFVACAALLLRHVVRNRRRRESRPS